MAVNRTSLIQQIMRAHAQGRVAATQQVVVVAAVPLGAALSGWIAESIGLCATVAIAAFGTIAATAVLLRSALWTTAAAELIEPLAEYDSATSEPHLATVDEPPMRHSARLWRFSTTPSPPAPPTNSPPPRSHPICERPATGHEGDSHHAGPHRAYRRLLCPRLVRHGSERADPHSTSVLDSECAR